MREAFEAIVLGGGVSGMVAASILLKRGQSDLGLVDQYDRLGGNHIDVDIGPYSFDIGSFFFADDSLFLSHFPQLLPEYLPADYTIERINPRGEVTGYPFSWRGDVVSRGPVEWLRILASVTRARALVDPDTDAMAYTEYWIGRRFADQSGLTYFLERFYGVEPHLIEAAFARKRMDWVARNASLKGLFERLMPNGPGPPNRQMVRPRAGFGPLYRIVHDALALRGVEVLLGEPLEAIRREPDGAFRIATARRSMSARTIVSTMPVMQVLALCDLPARRELESLALTSLFYSFEGRQGFSANVLYNFSRSGSWKRLTMHSDFYGPVNGRKFFTVEVVSRGAPTDVDGTNRAFVEHARQHGLFDGDLRLEGSRVTRNAYPVYVEGASAAATEAIARLRDFGILSFGRQGGFDYQPTADVSTAVAERALARA